LPSEGGKNEDLHFYTPQNIIKVNKSRRSYGLYKYYTLE